MDLGLRLLALLPLGDTTILIQGGRVRCSRGEVNPSLLGDIGDVLRLAGVAGGCIHARAGGGAIRLRIYGIPQQLHQRLRNVWTVYSV
ncbi:MAG: DUF3634 family protein [Planctomycetota bacterium]|jgi:hypothetical protein